jgi:hypothetical protein
MQNYVNIEGKLPILEMHPTFVLRCDTSKIYLHRLKFIFLFRLKDFLKGCLKTDFLAYEKNVQHSYSTSARYLL